MDEMMDFGGSSPSDDSDYISLDSGLASSLFETLDPIFTDLSEDAIFSGDDGSIVVGTPGADAFHWQIQTTGFTCAVQAQRGIIEAFTGKLISEAQLTYEATANGWLSDDGMYLADLGKLLESHGIPCHHNEGATVGDLISELAQGHKIIVGVDSGELWKQDWWWEDFMGQSADHAIWITGVRVDADGSMFVSINDSAIPDGAGKEYALDDFINAWQDSGFSYVATDKAPDGLAASVEGFDPNSGVFTDLFSALEQRVADFADYLDSPKAQEIWTSLQHAVGVGAAAALISLATDIPRALSDGDLTDVPDVLADAVLNGIVIGGVAFLEDIASLDDTDRNKLFEMV